jgi:hypothetical protein
MAAVFFRRRELLPQGASPTDLLVDGQQLLRQQTKAMIGLHLPLRLLPFRFAGKGFRDGLPVHLAGQPKVGAVPWIAALMAMAVGLAAGAAGGGDRSATKIRQLKHLLEQGAALLFQFLQGFQHNVLSWRGYTQLSLRITTLGYYLSGRNPCNPTLLCRAPQLSGDEQTDHIAPDLPNPDREKSILYPR